MRIETFEVLFSLGIFYMGLSDHNRNLISTSSLFLKMSEVQLNMNVTFCLYDQLTSSLSLSSMQAPFDVCFCDDSFLCLVSTSV